MKKAINAVWGIAKRAKIETLGTKMYLLDTIVRAGCLYSAEIWGWGQREVVERVHSRYTKIAMGVSRNTPLYIWQLETGRHSMDIESKKTAANYVINLCSMKDDRWPKVCFKEEPRAIGNNNPSKWGKELVAALTEVGDGETIDILLNGKIDERLPKNFGKMIEKKRSGNPS